MPYGYFGEYTIDKVNSYQINIGGDGIPEISYDDGEAPGMAWTSGAPGLIDEEPKINPGDWFLIVLGNDEIGDLDPSTEPQSTSMWCNGTRTGDSGCITCGRANNQVYQGLFLPPSEYHISMWIRHVEGELFRLDEFGEEVIDDKIVSLSLRSHGWPWHYMIEMDLGDVLRQSKDSMGVWKRVEMTVNWPDHYYEVTTGPSADFEYVNYADEGAYKSYPRYCCSGAGAECTYPDMINDDRSKYRNTSCWDGSRWRITRDTRQKASLRINSKGGYRDTLKIGIFGVSITRTQDYYTIWDTNWEPGPRYFHTNAYGPTIPSYWNMILNAESNDANECGPEYWHKTTLTKHGHFSIASENQHIYEYELMEVSGVTDSEYDWAVGMTNDNEGIFLRSDGMQQGDVEDCLTTIADAPGGGGAMGSGVGGGVVQDENPADPENPEDTGTQGESGGQPGGNT